MRVGAQAVDGTALRSSAGLGPGAERGLHGHGRAIEQLRRLEEEEGGIVPARARQKHRPQWYSVVLRLPSGLPNLSQKRDRMSVYS